MAVTQSACRQYHSTETAVTKVYNDLLLAADEGDVSALCLLDLTAAFDTVDHDVLMLRLERLFGLRGVVLQWFSSYLLDRTFQVVYGGSSSSMVIIVALYCMVLLWVRVCLFYTRRTLLMWLRQTTLTFTHTQMTLSYICSVNAGTLGRLLNAQMLITGWRRTDSS